MTPTEQVEKLTQQLCIEQERIRLVHSRMAQGNGLESAEDLEQSMRRREQLVEKIGLIVAEALLSGKHLTLTAPEPHGEGQDARATEVGSPANDGLEHLRAVFAGISNTSDLGTMQDFDARYRALSECVDQTAMWSACPAQAQRHLIGLTVALLRDLQEANEEFGRPLREPEIVGLVSKLSHWSKEHRPGWVNGMARGAAPEQDSWLDDAQYHADALRDIIEGGD